MSVELEALRDRWEHVRGGLLEVVDGLGDADLQYAPFPGSRDVGAMLRHIAHEEQIEVAWGLAGVLPAMPEEPQAPDLASIRVLLEDAHRPTREYLETLSSAALDREQESAWGERRRLGDFLWHALEHEIHHRGELSLVLGLLGREGLDA